ncbi:GYD domain-containing protein [Halobacterium bonnevillei]|uniref:GYD domain-containing protein n=1 Tax=Halobacterium bonnevillei TaxID=2692200 RepID=A0A6B0SL78_9EURY|nr:GYD domain-containing protein [Halobacterium bonnevillei]MXR21246.1 GYD domain-containing protein [Halobacterium bonnevillei]
MPTYAAFANVETGEYQNVQELASIWGDLRQDLETRNCDLLDAYILLGERDVLLLLEADSHDSALAASIAAQRYGIEMQTMEALHVDDLGELAEDRT